MENWIGKSLVIIGLIIVFEMGIGAWRLPNEFRSSIIPKLEKQISNYATLAKNCRDNIASLQLLTESHEKRIDMLSDIEKYNRSITE